MRIWSLRFTPIGWREWHFTLANVGVALALGPSANAVGLTGYDAQACEVGFFPTRGRLRQPPVTHGWLSAKGVEGLAEYLGNVLKRVGRRPGDREPVDTRDWPT